MNIFLVLCLGFVTWMWQQEQSTVIPTVVTMILLNGVPLVVSVSKSIFSFMLFLEVFLHSCKWFKVFHSWLIWTSGWSLRTSGWNFRVGRQSFLNFYLSYSLPNGNSFLGLMPSAEDVSIWGYQRTQKLC